MTSRILSAGAIALAFASPCALGADPAPFKVDFNKCFARNGDAPYVVTFAGPASGGATGDLEARIVMVNPGIEPEWTHIQADYVVAGPLAFTARVGGRVNTKTKLAVLRGYVSDGPAWLKGAGVHDEFENYTRSDGTACSKGILYITPGWKQSKDGGN